MAALVAAIDCAMQWPVDSEKSSSRAAQRRGDPEAGVLDCRVGFASSR
jgi:hypothetical protein